MKNKYLEYLLEKERLYCEKDKLIVTKRVYYSCECSNGKEGFPYCPHLSEIRSLKGRGK